MDEKSQSSTGNSIAKADAISDSSVIDSRSDSLVVNAPSNNVDDLAEIAPETNKVPEINQVYSLDEYIGAFARRYAEENIFQDMVHDYLKLSRWKRMTLKAGRKIARGWYDKRAGSIINDYAVKIKQDLEKAEQVERDLAELSEAQQQVSETAVQVRELAAITAQEEREYKKVVLQKDEAAARALQEIEEKKIREQKAAEEAKREIQIRTDAEKIVKEKLRESILNLPLLKADAAGNLQFDEKSMMNKFEDVLLKETLTAIEQKDGKKGFLGKIKRMYDDLPVRWDPIEDLSQLPDVDWVQSIIYSRTKGYEQPQFPWLIAGFGEDKNFESRAQINTAFSVDTSGSTGGVILEMEKKACFAAHALMRKMNPKNHTYLSYFNNQVYPLEAIDMLRTVPSGGGTNTELALQWFLEVLGRNEQGIAYLITDGLPNYMDKTIEVARKYQEYPNILLRVFLVNGDGDAKNNIRQIGTAAGQNTKVLLIDHNTLDQDVVRDIADSIGKMYDIVNF